jgi:hypothetical protein
MAKKPQEQRTIDVGDAELLGRVRAVIDAHHSPPRKVEALGFGLSMYRGKLLRLLFLLGVLSFLFAITFFQPGGPLGIWLLRLLWGGGILFFLFSPGWEGFSVARWARDGLSATADVLQVESRKDPDGDSHIRGRRVVHHPQLGDFEDEFEIVAPWIEKVRRGSTFDVLVAPRERRTWLTLGVHDRSPGPSEVG